MVNVYFCTNVDMCNTYTEDRVELLLVVRHLDSNCPRCHRLCPGQTWPHKSSSSDSKLQCSDAAGLT